MTAAILGVTYQLVGTQWVAPGRPPLPAGTVPPPPAPSGRPTGPGYTPYETIAGSLPFGPRVDSVGASQQATLDAGTFEFSNFMYPSEAVPDFGVLLLNAKGLHGSGVDQTFLRMVPNSSTRSALAPAHNPPATNGIVNPLYLFRIGWESAAYPRFLSGFTLDGTDQGHDYGGILLYQLVAGSSVKSVRVRGVTGSGAREPGETFAITTFRCTGTVFEDCEVDGRRNGVGLPVDGSGFSLNYGSDFVFTRCNGHHIQYGSSFAFYTTTNITMTQCKATNTYTYNGINFEKVSGNVIVDRCEVGANNGFHIGIFTNAENAVYTITDPIVEGQPISPTNKLRLRVTGYSGLPRTQNLADIHLVVGGVSRPDLMTQQLT